MPKGKITSKSSKKSAKTVIKRGGSQPPPIKIDNPYREIDYITCRRKSVKNSNIIVVFLEAEGAELLKANTYKEITYWACSCYRVKDAPDCLFRGKIKNFDPNITNGSIEIMKEHSDRCRYQAGNEAIDLDKYKNPRTKI